MWSLAPQQLDHQRKHYCGSLTQRGGGNYSMTSQCHTFQLACEVSWIDAGSSIKFIWLQLLTVHFSDDCGVISVA